MSDETLRGALRDALIEVFEDHDTGTGRTPEGDADFVLAALSTPESPPAPTILNPG